MNFISQILFAILATVSTGTLALCIWRVASRVCMRWNLRLPYLLLRIVCLLYVLPISYILMQLAIRDGYLQVVGLWQMNFAPAGELRELVAIIVTSWIFLTGRQIRVCLFAWVKTRRFCKSYIPEEDESVLAELARVKEKLQIHRRVDLYRSTGIVSPKTHGIFRCSIVLPMQGYSREQLSVIFHHELMHCKSCDIFYKLCCRYIEIAYHLGFVGTRMEELLDEWSEYDCDVRAIAAIRDEMSATRYFEMILDAMEEVSGRRDTNHIFSGLYESQLRLGRRIDYMKKYGNTKRVAKGVTAMVAMAFVLTNVTTVYAAGNKVAEVHDALYQSTELTAGESSSAVDLEEFYLSAADDTSYDALEYANPEAEMVMPLLDEDENVAIDWRVSPGVRKVSTSFHVDAGQRILISTTATPVSSVYWIGIMDEGNDVRYVQGSGGLLHEFEITESGSYRVLVQNRSRLTITAKGSYLFYTPTEESTEQ